MGFFSSALGAIGSAVSGMLNNSATDRANSAAQAARAQDIALQREFAQNSIQWRVNDAKAAGLHPLAALGVSGYSYSPVGLSTAPNDYSYVGNALGQMGQSIDSAREAGMTKAQRAKAEAISDQQTALGLEHQRLQNEVLQMEIASRKARLAQESRPGLPLATGPDGTVLIQGQGDSFQRSAVLPAPPRPTASGLIELTPPEVVINQPEKPSQQAGSNPDYSFNRLPDGSYAVSRMVNGQDPYEEDWLGGFSWNLRNRLANYFNPFDQSKAPPRDWLPKGYDRWQWNHFKSAWVPAKKSDGFGRQFVRSWSPF